jgi:hypothetical protein
MSSSTVTPSVIALQRSQSVGAFASRQRGFGRFSAWSLGSAAADFTRALVRAGATVAILLASTAGVFGTAATAAELDASGRQRLSQDTRAVLVITGMKLKEDPAGMVLEKDLAVAAGATVRVTKRGGRPEEKPTTLFGAGGPRAERGYFSADFGVDLDATYDIAMVFKDGTEIRVENYRLPKEWRTHFYFHSTRGTKSPASVLRIGRDEATGLACYVYAVFPVEAYRNLGGRQLP